MAVFRSGVHSTFSNVLFSNVSFSDVSFSDGAFSVKLFILGAFAAKHEAVGYMVGYFFLSDCMYNDM